MDPATAVEEFTARLRSDASEQVTLAAAGMVELGNGDAAPLLVERFVDPSLPESTRAALTQPIAALGDADVVPALVDAALDQSLGAQLRRLAADAAFAVEAEGMDDELRRLLAADDDYVRALAESMLEG
jgi:HEAT repeat protein